MRVDHVDASELRILLESAQIRTEAKAFLGSFPGGIGRGLYLRGTAGEPGFRGLGRRPRAAVVAREAGGRYEAPLLDARRESFNCWN